MQLEQGFGFLGPTNLMEGAEKSLDRMLDVSYAIIFVCACVLLFVLCVGRMVCELVSACSRVLVSACMFEDCDCAVLTAK